MRKKLLVCLILCVIGVVAPGAAAREPRGEVLGVRVGMSEEEVRGALGKVGRQLPGQDTKSQVWEVRDRQISHVILKYDRGRRVRSLTAQAHTAESKDRRRMRYGEVGNTGRAFQKPPAGEKSNFVYSWSVEPKGGALGYVVVARGSHPEYLTTFSIIIKRELQVGQ